MNKKASTVDSLFLIATFFGIVILFLALLVFWNVASGLNDFWSASSIGNTIKNNTQNAFNTFDFTLMMVYFALHIGVILTALFTRSSPIMYVVVFFMMLIVPLLAAPIANAYYDLIAEPSLTVASSQISMTNYIMSRLPMFEVIWSIITGIVLVGLARYEAFI